MIHKLLYVRPEKLIGILNYPVNTPQYSQYIIVHLGNKHAFRLSAFLHRNVPYPSPVTSRCNHFSRLMPGEAGNLSFEHDGEHGGAFEFSLGKERLFLGQQLETSSSPRVWQSCNVSGLV
jgi:hypothetical protein